MQRSGEARQRAPETRGVPARRRVLRARLPLEGRGVLRRASEDRRRPETDADSATLIDFLFVFLRIEMHFHKLELGIRVLGFHIVRMGCILGMSI